MPTSIRRRPLRVEMPMMGMVPAGSWSLGISYLDWALGLALELGWSWAVIWEFCIWRTVDSEDIGRQGQEVDAGITEGGRVLGIWVCIIEVAGVRGSPDIKHIWEMHARGSFASYNTRKT
ncbi:hypothetical protein N658DRAFT_232533 [Parathielavia hyrcaniae]|uniref:Uncharacterized protein n=1 Tax=Parathielavia hyrcaniae TaxID=113614 RepID=A0AAN6T4L2_9PEZI|nr:hypothetical protein N658DRAFT_232533 [Parathielavia hyrcaniae]